MYLDYSKLEFDAYGRPEVPELVLKTLSDRTLGILSGVHNLKFNVKFSEPSEMTFTIPSVIDGKRNPYYDSVTGRKIIYTDTYGVYVTMNPTVESDGIAETKSVKAYSLEKRLEDKRFFIEEGTFNFYHPTDKENTVIGRILEIARGWDVGYISPALIGRYRTFEQYDDYLLSFIYNTAPEKFRCVFVFDPYNKTISAYDADEERPMLPIYLDFDNLLENAEAEEISDELVTALRPYGADGLDIRNVNPIGANWIYNLSNFISNGDIPNDLAAKWQEWQQSILNQQEYYKGLVGLRASSNAQLLSLKAELVDLNGELTDLINQQSVTIQAIAMKTEDGKESQQDVLDGINLEITKKKDDISDKEGKIKSVETSIKSFAERIQSISDELSIENFFSAEEYSVLQEYFIEQDVTEDTFVATTIDTTVSGSSYDMGNSVIKIEEHRDKEGNLIPKTSSINRIDISDFDKQVYTMSGGAFSLTGNLPLSCNIIRGTLEVNKDASYIMSLYAGEIAVNDKKMSSGLVTISGTLSDLSSNIDKVIESGVEAYEGTQLSFSSSSGAMYLTANVNECQKYSVQMDLFDYATALLNDLATPTYEFSVDSGNFLFAQEFVPFRNRLELGCGLYLNINREKAIKPIIIEIEFGFEDTSEFSIIFSNRYKRHDSVNTLKDMIEKGYSSSRSFDASKHIYNQNTKQSSAVADFMNSSLDAAKNAILAAANQSVRIDGAGIHVGNDENQIRIVDNMIAMTDDGWQTAKTAIGKFVAPQVSKNDRGEYENGYGTFWGINTEVLAGKLAIAQNLFIESLGDDGKVVQFKVDPSGAWLNNSTFVLQKDNGGKIILDPKYGIAAGTGLLFDTDGTNVMPSFIKEDGSVDFDNDDVRFYLDIKDGHAYFKGTVNATAGKIGGFTIEDDFLCSGFGDGYVALNGSGSNVNSDYAFWAGGKTPDSAKFWVKKDGTVKASGEISASDLKINGQSVVTENNMISGNYIDYISAGKILAGEINAQLKIKSPTIDGGSIKGGSFRATGYGFNSDSESAYYIYNGNNRAGFLSYDRSGSIESTANSDTRVILASENFNPLKLRGATNISIEALGQYYDPSSGNSYYGHDGKIYLQGNLILAEKLSFGSSLPSTGSYGQVFFLLSS